MAAQSKVSNSKASDRPRVAQVANSVYCKRDGTACTRRIAANQGELKTAKQGGQNGQPITYGEGGYLSAREKPDARNSNTGRRPDRNMRPLTKQHNAANRRQDDIKPGQKA